MKEAIEAAIRENMENNWGLIDPPTAAATIAALLEDEKAIMETVWITKCVKLEARLAEMKDLIREVLDSPIGARIEHQAKAEQILAAAGEGRVLWSGEGHIFHQVDLPEYLQNLYTILDIEGDELFLSDGHIGKDGQHVRVLVIEEPPDAEQGKVAPE